LDKEVPNQVTLLLYSIQLVQNSVTKR